MRRIRLSLALVALVIQFASPIQGAPHIGLLLDSSSDAESGWAELVRDEFRALLGDETSFTSEVADTTGGDPDVDGAARRLLGNPSIDAVIAVGPAGSQHLSGRASARKPTLSLYVLDVELQQLDSAGAAGELAPLESQLRRFATIEPFEQPALLIDPAWSGASQEVLERAVAIAARAGLRATAVAVTGPVETTLREIPRDADAAVLFPLLSLDDSALSQLADALTERGLPSFSLLGEPHVRRGVFAGLRSSSNLQERARRAALAVQRALRGEPARQAATDAAGPERVYLNLATARRLGIDPSSELRLSSVAIDREPPRAENGAAPSEALDLRGLAGEIVAASRELAAKRRELEASHQRVLLAGSELLPQVDVGLSYRQVNKGAARGFEGFLPERQVSGDVSIEQSIYDEKKWAERAIEKHLHRAQEFDEQTLQLDVGLEGLLAGIALLRARSVTEIERSQVRVSEENLERARVRRRVGSAADGEVLRWKAELANDRQRLVLALAHEDTARMQLNRLRYRPLEEPVALAEVSLASHGFEFAAPGVAEALTRPGGAATLRGFMVAEGVEHAPELARIEALIESQTRALDSRNRAFWQPTLSAIGLIHSRFHRGGEGSSGEAGDRTNWVAAAQARIPLFTGGARVFARREALEQLRALKLEREETAQQIRESIRSRYRLASAAHQNIGLAEAAADASLRNADLVRTAYARGSARLVDVIDAQSAARQSSLRRADALHDFVAEKLRAERAAGRLYVLASAEERAVLLDRLRSLLATRR